MKTLNRITSAVLGILLTTGALAEKPESTLFYMSGSSSCYKISFTLASHLVVLPAIINGSDSLNFIFDTGVGRTFVTDLPNADALSLNEMRKIKLRGLGNSQSFDGYLSSGNDLALGHIKGRDQEVLVIPNNMLDLSSRVGCKVNGAIGQSIFERFIVEIDYSNQTARFYNPKKFERKIRRNEEVIPLEIIDGKPYITAYVTIEGKRFAVKLLFDTGMSFPLWLDPSTNGVIRPAALHRREVLAQGLSGDISGSLSRVERFEIGGFSFNEVVTAFPDSASIGEATSENGRNGSVGADIFRRFTVVIDYSNKRLILRKNSNYKHPFTYDMSGIEVGSIIAGFPFYKISSVGKDTPADECGLQVNDEMFSINGIKTATMTVNEITEIHKSKEGRTLRIQVLRNGQLIKVKMKLRRLV